MENPSNILSGPFGRAALLSLKAPLTTHAHAHCHLIMKLSGPDQFFVVDGRTLPLSNDRAVLVNAWQEHCYTPANVDAPNFYLALYLNPDWLRQCDSIFENCHLPGFFSELSAPISHVARQLAADLRDVLGRADPQSNAASALIAELMAEFSRGGQSEKSVRYPLSDYRIRRAITQMHKSCDVPYDYNGLARLSGLSRSRFNVLFKETVGVGPAIYGNALRLEAAVSALASRLPAHDVATDLGFSSPGNFSRFFQHHTGVPPARYRKSLQKIAS